MSTVGVVYKFTNTITNQFYIGSAVNFHIRKRNHLSLLRRNSHHNPILQNSYNKYGLSSFEFSILESNITSDILLQKEQYWIDKLNPYFNVLRVAGTHLGAKRNQETKDKISKALTGKKLSEAHKEKVRQANIGKRYSQETKNKHSQSNLKRWSSFYKPVAQIDKETSEVIKIFKNPSSAERELNIYRGGISFVLRKEKSTAGGFKWRQINE